MIHVCDSCLSCIRTKNVIPGVYSMQIPKTVISYYFSLSSIYTPWMISLVYLLFGSTYIKIGTIQRRLAWPLRKDDTQIREAFYIFFNKKRKRKKKKNPPPSLRPGEDSNSPHTSVRGVQFRYLFLVIK